MTGAEIIENFREGVDDQLDETYEYQLLNEAKDEIEASQIWLQLEKEQEYTVSSGLSFGTALGALPTRFALDVRLVEDEGNFDYDKVGFDDRSQKKNNPTGFFLDINAGNIHLTGENHAAKTLYLYYTEYSAEITSTDTWAFPSRFHDLIALKMKQLYYPSDAGEKSRSWDDRWNTQFDKRIAQMQLWNDSLKVRNRRASQPFSYGTPKSLRRGRSHR